MDEQFFAKLKEVADVMRTDRIPYALERLPLTAAKLAGYQNRRWPEGERSQVSVSLADSLLVLWEVAAAQGMLEAVGKDMARLLDAHEKRAVNVLEQRKKL